MKARKTLSFDKARNVLIEKTRDMDSEKNISTRFHKISKLFRSAKEQEVVNV